MNKIELIKAEKDGLKIENIPQIFDLLEEVDIYMGGRTGIDPKLSVKVMEDVPCDQLARVLEFLIPYHAREKMHPIKGKKYLRRHNSTLPKKPQRQIEENVLEEIKNTH